MRTLVFDVLGTVLDEEAGRRNAVATLAIPPSERAGLAEEWRARCDRRTAAIVGGERGYATPHAVAAAVLAELVAERGLPVARDEVARAAAFGHRLAPFADSRDALDRLGGRFALLALTNAGLAQAFAMTAHAGLRWAALLSGELVSAYKPDPRVYRLAIDRLGLDPAATTMVAAHDWDLDAAATHGLGTAYVDRGAPADLVAVARRFDRVAPDLGGLADQLLEA